MPDLRTAGGVVGRVGLPALRCRLIDLGAWLTEQHKIPDEDADAADDASRVEEARGEPS
jgi:hypothetical protein